MNKDAIVIVHFGTTHRDTIKKALDPFVRDAMASFDNYDVFEAYSSRFIRSALERRHGIVKKSLEEVLDELAEKEYQRVIVQPTVLMMGLEYEKLSAIVGSCAGRFDRLVLGKPLVNSREDYCALLMALDMEYGIRQDACDAFLFMGHGSNHPGEAIYAAIDYRMKHAGMKNAFVATVEGYPSLDDVIPDMMMYEPEVIYMIPLMVVAGDHARNDMAGDDKDSWKSRLEAAGFEVVPIVKGLGEIPAVRAIVLRHIEDCFEQ